MFHLQRQTVLDESKWALGDRHLRYIEAQTFENANTLTPDTYREGDLKDSDVQDWLRQKGRFAPPSGSHLGEKEGGIRLLLCERQKFTPLVFGLSKSSLLAIESEFGLPSEMLPMFKFNGGSHSYYFRSSTSHDQKPEQLVITVKVPQMFQVANFGLCMSYSFKTRTTLAFMFGWNLIHNENWRHCMKRESPEYLEPHIRRISGLIKSQISKWEHPLLLPAILLDDHVHKADRFKGLDLSPRVTKLEGQLLATKAGRNGDQQAPLDFESVSLNIASERFELTRSINTTVTDAVSFGCNMKWDIKYCQFLQDIAKKLNTFPQTAHDTWGPNLEDEIEVLTTFAISILEHTESLQARLGIQLDVLYNLAAQSDSNTNSNIAVTMGLDSVAMKALAFVTTVFLPPTFIATLFSMSMFDWQTGESSSPTDNDTSGKTVSRYFGIYWAISLPLTAVVLFLWRVWWYRKKDHFRRRYPHVKMDPDFWMDLFKHLSGMVSRREERKESVELAEMA